ncbi:hypothetical protein SH449x_002158 [Pirellulaceae bacterium SH449]
MTRVQEIADIRAALPDEYSWIICLRRFFRDDGKCSIADSEFATMSIIWLRNAKDWLGAHAERPSEK